MRGVFAVSSVVKKRVEQGVFKGRRALFFHLFSKCADRGSLTPVLFEGRPYCAGICSTTLDGKQRSMMIVEIVVWIKVPLTLNGTNIMMVKSIEGAKVRPRREAACTKALLSSTT